MTDGVVLLADRWAPAATANSSPPPVVLVRSPYGRREVGVIGRLFAERGYQVLIQSCRGTFGSGGDWVPFRHEEADGQATLAWLAEQPWFSGTVCTFGPSYLGLVQWAVCGDPPAWLKAMAPAVTATNFRDAVIYPGNTLGLETMLSLGVPGRAPGVVSAPGAALDAHPAQDGRPGRGHVAPGRRRPARRSAKGRLLPGLAGPRATRGSLVGRGGLPGRTRAGATRHLPRWLVRHLPARAGRRLRGHARRRSGRPG